MRKCSFRVFVTCSGRRLIKQKLCCSWQVQWWGHHSLFTTLHTSAETYLLDSDSLKKSQLSSWLLTLHVSLSQQRERVLSLNLTQGFDVQVRVSLHEMLSASETSLIPQDGMSMSWSPSEFRKTQGSFSSASWWDKVSWCSVTAHTHN